MAQLVAGLITLHASKKVHRDIKPSNMLVRDGDGRLVLLDFGVAIDLEERGAAAEDGVVGTISYMAPEQALGEEVGPAADLYAVGVLLYELLTGTLPFTSATDVMIRKVSELPPPPSSRVPDTSEDLDTLTMALLAVDAAERPGADEVLTIFEGTHRHEATTSLSSLFVGREQEIAQRHAAYARTRAGAATVWSSKGNRASAKARCSARSCRRAAPGRRSPARAPGELSRARARAVRGVRGVFDGVARALESSPDRDAILPPQAHLLAQVFPALFVHDPQEALE